MVALTYFPEPRAVLGEAPLWDPAGNRLWWVDCDQKMLFRLDPESEKIDQFNVPHHPGCYAFRNAGGMIMAYRNQLALVDAQRGRNEPLQAPDVDFSIERFNDGACDRRGRFWAGTMHRKRTDPTGSLYRIDPDLSVHRMAKGFTVSNGIAFSPDDRIMYHTDSRAATIYAYDFDIEKGTIANQRIFADFRDDGGRPDGCTIDAEGCLWVVVVNAAKVVRVDPSGHRTHAVNLPVTRPTSAMLGGRDLRTLYITSMQDALTPEELERQPQAGCLFAVRVDVPGLPEPYFAG